MEKINFEAGTQVSPAKVTIDNVEHEVTPSVWEGNTPLSPFVLNKMQSNIENAISESGVIVSATEPTGANREKLWLKTIENLFKNEQIVQNANIQSNGTIVTDSSYKLYYISCEPNTTYLITYNNKETNSIVISSTPEVPAIGVTGNVRKVASDKCYYTTRNIDQYLIIRDDIAGTNKKIGIKIIKASNKEIAYIKDNNNIYQEFIPNEDEIVKNSNGTAIKFANGMMICTIDTLIGTYNDASKTYIASWTFPVAFVETPIYCGGTVFAGNSKAYSVTAVGLSNTSVYIHTKCLGANGTVETCDRSANCIAIGRYK